MTAKEWLEHAKYCKYKIRSLERLKKEMLADATQTTQAPKQDVVQTSRGNAAEARTIRYIIDVADINRHIKKLQAEKQAVIDVVYAVGDPRYQEVLAMRYLQGKKWETVADEMGYSDVRTVYRLHIRALSAVEPIIRKAIAEHKCQ